MFQCPCFALFHHVGAVGFMFELYKCVYVFNILTEYQSIKFCSKNVSKVVELVFLLQKKPCRNSGAGVLIVDIESKSVSTEFYQADSNTEGPRDPEVCDP